MNIFTRIVRLPFVATHPITRVIGWAAVTAIDVASRTPQALPPTDPVARFEILGVANKLIHQFVASKDNQMSMFKWCLKNAVGLTKSIVVSLTRTTTDNQIDAANIPNIMAGRIRGNALVPGLSADVFVIGLSPNMVNFLGFLFLSIKGLITGFLISQVIWLFIRYFNNTSENDNEDRQYIDVQGRTINSIRNNYLTKLKKKH